LNFFFPVSIDYNSLYNETFRETREQVTVKDIESGAKAPPSEAPDHSTYSVSEWETRIELAALYRSVDLYGMSDLVNGAIGARVPGRDQYLTHPYGMYWEEATASSFITIHPDGSPVFDDSRWTNDGAVNLCRWIFSTRPDINFFVHGHDEPIAAVGSIECGLLWINQPAVYLGHMLGYLEYEFTEDEAFGAHFCELVATNNILISRNHGHYSLGRKPSEAFFRAYFLHQACSVQIQAMSTGATLHLISDDEVERFQRQMYTSPHYNYDGETEWPGLLRKLGRECPGFDR